MMRFDDFAVGAVLGEQALTVDETMLAAWGQLFPDDLAGSPAAVPPGFVAIVSMRAYAQVVAPRPPGNVHGSQRFDLQRLPRVGERVSTRITCTGKAVRRERRWVDFLCETTGGDGAPCFSGRMAIAWAA